MIQSDELTTRQQILDELKRLMEEAADNSSSPLFKQVELTRTVPPDLETISLPACFIYSDREFRLEDDKAVIGKETWEWFIIIEVWAMYEELETILKFIHSKIYDNYTIGGYVNWAERTGVDFLTIDPTRNIESMAIPYRIIYRHTSGAM